MWSQALKIPQPDEVLRYVIRAWDDYRPTVAASIDGWKEPDITKAFAHFLDDRTRRKAARMGRFRCEVQTTGQVQPSGKVKYLGRTDIEYFSQGEGECLVFEFKLLRRKGQHCHYCNEGVAKYVNGVYGGDAAIGVMCALHSSGAWRQDLLKYLARKATIKKLSSQCFPSTASYIQDPATKFPEANHAAGFESLHARTNGRCDIHLVHLFLPTA